MEDKDSLGTTKGEWRKGREESKGENAAALDD